MRGDVPARPAGVGRFKHRAKPACCQRQIDSGVTQGSKFGLISALPVSARVGEQLLLRPVNRGRFGVGNYETLPSVLRLNRSGRYDPDPCLYASAERHADPASRVRCPSMPGGHCAG
jgi:hypothetical protein